MEGGRDEADLTGKLFKKIRSPWVNHMLSLSRPNHPIATYSSLAPRELAVEVPAAWMPGIDLLRGPCRTVPPVAQRQCPSSCHRRVHLICEGDGEEARGRDGKAGMARRGDETSPVSVWSSGLEPASASRSYKAECALRACLK